MEGVVNRLAPGCQKTLWRWSKKEKKRDKAEIISGILAPLVNAPRVEKKFEVKTKKKRGKENAMYQRLFAMYQRLFAMCQRLFAINRRLLSINQRLLSMNLRLFAMSQRLFVMCPSLNAMCQRFLQ